MKGKTIILKSCLRREKRRKMLEKETPDGKEYRLAKRRAADKRRSEAW